MVRYALLAVFCHIYLAFGVEDNYVVKDYHKAPAAWQDIGPAPEHHSLLLRIGLTQRDFPELERQLYEISDPSHARYGQYLSQAAIHDLITPHPDTLHKVESWLEQAGFDSDQWEYNSAKTWISLPVSVGEAESLLDTTFSLYVHRDGSELVRTESWSLPASLHPHITTIQPTNSWARMKPNVPVNYPRSSHVLTVPDNLPDIPLSLNSTITGVCNFSAVDPNCIRTLYGTASYTTKSNGASQIGIANYLGETNNRSDTYQFLQRYRPEAAHVAETFPQISIAGGAIDDGSSTADAGTGTEGNLDSEYVLGVGYPLPPTTYSTVNPPSHRSSPLPTATTNRHVPYSYAQAVCNEMAQITARGVTLLFASGDAGVGTDGTCYSNKDNSTYQFLPQFPSRCPYFTSVGATKGYPEEAAGTLNDDGSIYFKSGGGFSNYFSSPSYQKDTVGRYVAGLNGTYDGFYNRSGRAYPDISCVGQQFPIIWNGTSYRVVGISGSAPICAAVPGFANDALLVAGRPPLGFLNPWLYSAGFNTFTDVTSGDSAGCDTSGFPAVEGWDAVTGFGTPYLPSVLKELVL